MTKEEGMTNFRMTNGGMSRGRFAAGISRRDLLFVILSSFVIPSFVISPGFAAPPNVVLIISDDQGWPDFGFMGHKEIRTPHLDRLAAQSAVFGRGYVPTSLCRASLASLITGLYPHQHKLTSNDPPKGTDRAAMLRHIEAVPTVPRLLAEKGYQSLQTGKWWEGSYRLGGFTHGMTHGDPRGKPAGRHGDAGLRIGREGLRPIFDFIEGRGEKPFFVWYAPMMPHTPHNPPERLLKKYERADRSPFVAKYFAMCEWFDETCGELLAYLDEKKLADNTLVLFVTDNGWIQSTDSAAFAPKSKRSPYDGGLRTPILLRWPGKIKPQRDDETLVMSLDLVPTLLAVCGAPPSKEMPGIDLVELCAGKPSPRKAIYGEIFTHDAVDIDRPAANVQYRWCIDGQWKLIAPQGGGAKAELYDLRADPHETKDLATEQAEIAARLARQIDTWWPAK
jgi:uncharacterized sulfatase